MRLLRSVGILIVVWTLCVAAIARAGEPEAATEDDVLYDCAKAKGKFTVTLRPDVELKDLVTWAMGFSCKKFLYSSTLASRSAKVTIMTPGTLTASEAWSLFQAALRTMQLAVVPKGKALQIVESATAKDEALAILKEFPDGGADVVRLLLRPEHVSVDDLRAALELVRSSHGVVSPLPNLHAILITDDAAHVARMETLVTELDKPTTGDTVYAIPLDHVDAESVVATVQTLLGDGKEKMRLVADARLNAVFLAGSASDYLRVRALAKAIDVDAGDTARVRLIKLAHVQAKDVAAALAPVLGEGAKVAPDETSNALLVLASAREAADLEAIIAEMDVPRRQVYLEVLVLEVESSRGIEVGSAWHIGKPGSNGKTWIGAQESSETSSIDPVGTIGTLSGVLGGVIGKEIEVLGQTIPSLGLLIEANRHTSRLDVLSSPHIMTVDNQKATISVGSNIPYKSSNGGASATGTILPPNIERQKVALSLAVTPHVSAPDTVRLDLALESAQLGAENFGDDLGPTWKERSLETTVVLKDQESIVLGGLVDERIEDEVTGIPFLADIPVLGALFRQTKKKRMKSNLLIILTPHLIDDSIAGRELLARRMREREEFLRAADELEERVLDPDVDYRKKCGLLADIDATVEGIERDRAALEAARAKAAVPDGAITE